LGFGLTTPDYNRDLIPGPLEVGFDDYFGYPATNDRVPTVYVRNHRVIGLDPADPIHVTYQRPADAGPGRGNVVAGRRRIGWMTGGAAALWDDARMGAVLTSNAVEFIERHHQRPFFLYFATHAVHAPTVPPSSARGRTGLGNRADMVCDLDDSMGEILGVLDRLNQTTNTLVVFTSDNGAYAEDEQGHRPNGPWRGVKSQLYEGGHREPLLVRWPGRIAPGVSDALVSLADLPSTVAALTQQTLPAEAAPDSANLLPLFLGQTNRSPHDAIVVMGGNGALALRRGDWKYIPDLNKALGWQSPGGNRPPVPGLFNLTEDPGERRNLAKDHPDRVKALDSMLARIRRVESVPTAVADDSSGG
jgi:arylsulfatase A-like enzyme